MAMHGNLDSSSNGVRPMDDSMLSFLREMCDKYFDPLHCDVGAACTYFDIDGIEYINHWAEAALKLYNEKEQKNFYLEKVGKLNGFVMYYFLTFWARTAENAERRLFRGVVDMRTRDIKLCEIKDDDKIVIPVDHSEKRRLQRSRSDGYVPKSSAGGLVDASSGAAVGHGCVDLGKVDEFCPIGHSMLWALRDLCDEYFDPRDCDPSSGISHICFDDIDEVNYFAELALEFYNGKEQKNFYLEEVGKLNIFFAYYCLTFWARTAANHERSLFRGVVHLMGCDKVVLCEIKDDGEITIPVDHSENCRLERSRIDDYKANDTADASVDASSGADVGRGVALGKLFETLSRKSHTVASVLSPSLKPFAPSLSSPTVAVRCPKPSEKCTAASMDFPQAWSSVFGLNRVRASRMIPSASTAGSAWLLGPILLRFVVFRRGSDGLSSRTVSG